MTNKEAIWRIKDHMIVHQLNEPKAIKITEALEMAIKVLEQQPCEDAISREAVEKITWEEPTYTDPLNVLTEVREKVRNLPSITPIRPKGKWETGYTYPDGEYWKCSVCKELIRVRFPMHFCSNCSADMRGIENDIPTSKRI